MNKNTQKTMWIVMGTVGGAMALGAAAVGVWNSKQMKTMRAMKKTNAVIHRVGTTLCKISEAGDE